MDQAEAIALCEKIFAKYLDGQPLMSNAAHLPGPAAWLKFRRIICDRWHYGKLILLGDAAHTAHFSIGSGTKLALEDAIKLAEVLNRPGLDRSRRRSPNIRPSGTSRCSSSRTAPATRPNGSRRSTAISTSSRWQFAYSLLTRSQRISHENLRLRDKRLARRASSAGSGSGRAARQKPPRRCSRRSSCANWSSRTASSSRRWRCIRPRTGRPNDFHLVHYGARAQGGAGLVFTEMTCVSPDGRITPGCTGMYTHEHVAAWRRIVDFVHANCSAKICLQLGHSGAKGSTQLGWEGYDVPLDDGNWPVMAASDVPWTPANQVPRPMTRADMDGVRDEFVAAVRMGLEAGFDMVELHAAHGYLLSSFITPLHNKRTDEYGGSLENRLRFPLEVFAAMREAWPADRPMSVRISANDWMGDAGRHAGRGGRDRRAFAESRRRPDRRLGRPDLGRCQPVYGRMFQTPFSDKIRNEGQASRPWRSATSTSPTTSIRSWPPAAPTWSRSPART